MRLAAEREVWAGRGWKRELGTKTAPEEVEMLDACLCLYEVDVAEAEGAEDDGEAREMRMW